MSCGGGGGCGNYGVLGGCPITWGTMQALAAVACAPGYGGPCGGGGFGWGGCGGQPPYWPPVSCFPHPGNPGIVPPGYPFSGLPSVSFTPSPTPGASPGFNPTSTMGRPMIGGSINVMADAQIDIGPAAALNRYNQGLGTAIGNALAGAIAGATGNAGGLGSFL